MRRIPALLVGTSLLVVGLAVPPVVSANDVYVNSLSDSSPASDGFCTLREAIVATNLNIANTNPDCDDGTGATLDVIRFNTGGLITLTGPLPDITGEVEIDGNNGIVIDGVDAFRPFAVITGGLTLRELTVQDGNGGSGFGFGGVVSNGATTIIVDTVIRSSRAGYGGGVHNNGTMIIVSSTIEGNDAETAGGGIFNEGTMSLRNVTITGNNAPAGAGTYNTGTATVAHVTIARNAASPGGGGGVNKNAGSMTIVNSIIVSNTGNQTVGSPGHAYSVVQTSADGVIDTALRDNGGPTPTFRVLAGSPALSIADPAWCGYVGYVDQRGLPRPSGASSTCDAGAVQRDRTAPVKVRNPSMELRQEVPLSGDRIRSRVLDWAFDDGAGIGIERFSLQRQRDGGSWTSLSTTIPPQADVATAATGRYNVNVANWHRYRFRVRAVDLDGNVSAWAYSPTVTARLVQQTSSAVTFSRTGWSTVSSPSYSGGSVRKTTTPGSSMRITFTGRAISLVTTFRGGPPIAVDAYVDGVYWGRLEHSSFVTQYRRQVWPLRFAGSAEHTVRYVNVGPGRLDIDAFAILK